MTTKMSKIKYCKFLIQLNNFFNNKQKHIQKYAKIWLSCKKNQKQVSIKKTS